MIQRVIQPYALKIVPLITVSKALSTIVCRRVASFPTRCSTPWHDQIDQSTAYYRYDHTGTWVCVTGKSRFKVVSREEVARQGGITRCSETERPSILLQQPFR